MKNIWGISQFCLLILFITNGTYAFSQISPNVKSKSDILPISAEENLRLSLFKDPKVPLCITVKSHPKGNTQIDSKLSRLLSTFIDGMSSKNEKVIQPLFHPRLNISLESIAEIQARIGNTYGLPIDFSLYRLWALNTSDGTPQELQCSDGELTLYAQYGYPLQFGAWLQIMGTKELGRIFLSIVPLNEAWYVGAFHLQQWTHETKDPFAWGQEAEKDLKNQSTISSYVKYDIARKLADGGKLLTLNLYSELERKQKSVMSQADWEKSMQNELKPIQPVYLGTLLVKEGAGILVRQKIDQEISVENMKKNCESIASQLSQKHWSKNLVGIRCSYNLTKEDPKSEGALGGIFQSFKELKFNR